jgi:hypothetical protein
MIARMLSVSLPVSLPVPLCVSLCMSLCVSFASGASCRQQPEPAPPDPAAVLAEVRETFAAEGITFDNKAHTVVVKAVVNAPQDPIEYLLIHRKGKRHEAVLWTLSKPSVLNAALLMLGLEPGKNATFVEKEPMPTLEEIQAGADPLIVTPPSGTNLWMTVRWPGPDGKQVEHCVEDLIVDMTTGEPLAEAKWIYLGGRMASLYKGEPEEFVADFEGNLVSVCYLMPDNHLATMAHERARDDQNWWLTKLVPEPGTEVEFVFHKIEPPLHVERTKRLRAEAAKREAAAKPAEKGGR